MACPVSCTACSDGSTCTACSANYALAPNGTCVTCWDGQYLDTAASWSCLACSSNCSTCSDFSTCTGCGANYSLDASSYCVPAPNGGGGSSSDPGASELTASQELSALLAAAVATLMENAGMASLNKVPGGRKALPFLCFMANLDELWLYQYHERNYGTTMNDFFATVQTMESDKWKLLSVEVTEGVYQRLGTSREDIYAFIDTKYNYTHPAFLAAEGRGETFLPACFEFFTFNLLFVVAGFLLLMLGGRLLKGWRVRKLLRAFSSFVFLAPLLLEGNLQYFLFLLFTQQERGFSLSLRDKGLTALNYLLYFLVLWLALASAFLAYSLSKKRAKHILDSWRSRVAGLLAFSFTNTTRMLLFGALHSLLRSHPAQLPILLAVELTFIVVLVTSMRRWRAHKVAFKIWFAIVFGLLRIVLQLTLFVQQRLGIVGSGSAEEGLVNNVLGSLLVFYLINFYISTLWELAYEIV
jgi:hypothetical protein